MNPAYAATGGRAVTATTSSTSIPRILLARASQGEQLVQISHTRIPYSARSCRICELEISLEPLRACMLERAGQDHSTWHVMHRDCSCGYSKHPEDGTLCNLNNSKLAFLEHRTMEVSTSAYVTGLYVMRCVRESDSK